MSGQSIEEKIVFGISEDGTGDGVPLLLLGVPVGAWEYMSDGKTHTFDLTKAGLPIKLILFGAADHSAAIGVIEEHNRSVGLPYLDERRSDFSIQPTRGKRK